MARFFSLLTCGVFARRVNSSSAPPIERIARVLALEAEGRARVTIAGGGCGRCHEAGGCGEISFSRLFHACPREISVENLAGAKPGEEVIVAFSAEILRQQANAAYLWPLLALLFGALAGHAVGGESGALLGCATGLAFAWLFLLWQGKRLGKAKARPYIIRLPSQSGQGVFQGES
ncbi:MAG: SoxR reducing system RseC family protein [Zoogloeaceae bacterium]|jgi:sigma-E factor negative regulatory protein RseC|nr:SoxR reducing system RseC family protein [Zoogloeaceae bacterium]